MKKLLQRMWADDRGAIITVEWIVFVTIFLLGLIPAMAMARAAITAAVANVLNNVLSASLLFGGVDNGISVGEGGAAPIVAGTNPFTYGNQTSIAADAAVYIVDADIFPSGTLVTSPVTIGAAVAVDPIQ